MSDPQGHRASFYKSLNEARIVDARAAVYAGMYINGLAVTATVATIGLLSSKAEPLVAHHHAPKAFVWALGLFAGGVLSSALAATVAYLANLNYAEAETPHELDVHSRNRRRWTATLFHMCGYGFCFGSLALFTLGIVAGVIGFDGL